MSFEPGHVIADKYRIVRMIGRGGVGEVYEGENLRIRRKVAIKTLKAEFVAKADIVQRFEREAQAAGRIGSAHIVEVVDLGDLPDGARFLVMEYLEGETLSRRIKTVGRMTPVEAAHLVVQLLEGLGGAHAAGIVHRDLKPANIYLVPRNGESFVKILDFGVSKFNTLASDELSMTKTGVVMGTPYYMAPEQAKGSRSVDGRADIYAVGVIAYECVTGQVPFSAQTFNELLFKIVLEAPPPIEQFVPDVDPYFASLVRKAMSREPNMRFQTTAEFQQALSEWLVQATGGALGHTLAQTATFESAGSTMIFQAPVPPARRQSAPPGPPPPVLQGGEPSAGWSANDAAPGQDLQVGLPQPGPGLAGTDRSRSSLAPWIAAGSVGLLVLLGAVFTLVRWSGGEAAGTPGEPTTPSATTTPVAVAQAPAEPPAPEAEKPPPTVAPPSPPPLAAPPPTVPAPTVPPPTVPPQPGPKAPPTAPATAKTSQGTGRPPPAGAPKTGRPISGDL